MKWPEALTLIRHDVSEYNILKNKKEEDKRYQKFLDSYNVNPDSKRCRKLALDVVKRFSLGYGDHKTPLADSFGEQAKSMATSLRSRIKIPDIIFVSPYTRTYQTLEKMKEGWPELAGVRTIEEERIREQDHEIVMLSNDWRVFNVLYPDQRDLREMQGSYWYRYPQGESVPDVRERLRSWLTTITRDYSEKGVLAVTHHLAILSLRANLERLSADEFIKLDKENKPINAGITIYRGDPTTGENGHLVLDAYNVKLY